MLKPNPNILCCNNERMVVALQNELFAEREKNAHLQYMYDNLLIDFKKIYRYAKAYKHHYDQTLKDVRAEHVVEVTIWD